MSTLFTIILFLSATGYATVLGELKGTGDIKVRSQVVDTGRNSSYDRACTLAMNIKDSIENFNFDFAVVQCGGLVFNDAVPELKKINGKLYNEKNQEIGSYSPDGYFRFTITEPTRAESYTEFIPGGDCRYESGQVLKKNFSLRSNRIYEFTKTASGWDIDIRYYSEKVESYNKKIYGLCSYAAYSKAVDTSSLQGSVQ